MRNKWLLYLVLFMLAANAALVTIMLIKNSEFVGQNIDFKNKFQGKPEMKFENHLAKELGFDEVQMNEISIFSNDFHRIRKAKRDELFSLREEYFKVVSQANPDTLVLYNIERRIGEIEAQKVKEEYIHYRNIRSVCNKQQALKMDSIGRTHMHHKFRKIDSEGKCRQGQSDQSQTNKN